jgi:hypothetical protein
MAAYPLTADHLGRRIGYKPDQGRHDFFVIS